MLHELLAATALVLIFEGILPFLSPAHYRSTMQRLGEFKDPTLRVIGLASMVLGLVALYSVR